MADKLLIAIDVGGTFTDVVGMTSSGKMALVKVPSTPADPSQGVVTGLTRLLDDTKLSAADVARFIHGTTVATNAVVEQKGAVTGLLTTAGFEDVLTIGRHKRSELYNLRIGPEEPLFLAPRRRIRGIPERLDSAGQVLVPLDEAAVLREVSDLVERHGVTALVVCYLFGYLDPRHEQRTLRIGVLAGHRRQLLGELLEGEIDPERRAVLAHEIRRVRHVRRGAGRYDREHRRRHGARL